MGKPRIALKECIALMGARYPTVAEHFLQMFDEDRLAAMIKDLHPNLKMTTAYKRAEEIRVILGLSK